MLEGTIHVFLAQALFPLTALITTAFLTRRLGPEGYGLLVLAATLVVWVETSIDSLFSRAAIKFVGNAQDWRPIGSAIARLHLSASSSAAVLLVLLSVPLAQLLSEPVLAGYLCLFALKVLGGTAVQAGMYGAAQNLSLLPGLFATSFSPLLLATLSRLLRDGRASLAREISRNAMRAVLGLLPVAAMIAGATHEIVGFFFGTIFLPAAQLLGMLIFGAVALVMISVAIAIVTAAGKPRWTLILTGPLVPLAVIGHLLLIPRFGPLGASIVTTLLAGLGALVAVLAIYRLWQIVPPTMTLGRSILVSGLAYALALLWPVPGSLVLPKLLVIGSVVLLAFLVLGEFNKSEIAMVRSILPWRTAPTQHPHEV